MGTGKGTAAMSYAPSQSTRLPKGVDPNNVGMLSIPKQTKIFVERLRAEAEANGDKRFD
jgi:hypothetical protein